MRTDIYIGKDRIVLYNDEIIEVNSSVSKIEDITKVFTDSSNNFTVPCNEVNNTIFKRWFDSDIINGFDARKKVLGAVYLDGMHYKTVKIRLTKVNFKNNVPDSFSLEFFGLLVDLKDILKDDTINDLEDESLKFELTYDNVKQKLQSQGDVCCSLFAEKRLLYDSSMGLSESDTISNIYYNGTSGSTGVLYSDLFFSLKQIKIIEAIESKYNILFSRDFFGEYDFKNQYMLLSGKNDKTSFQIPITNPTNNNDPTVSGNVMLSSGVDSLTRRVECSFFIDSDYENVVYNCYIKKNDDIISKREGITGDLIGSNNLRVSQSDIDGGLENITFWIESDKPISFNCNIYRYVNGIVNFYRFSPSGLNLSTDVNPMKRLPEIKIIDYLKGLFNKYRLIAIKEEDTIYVDPLINYYKKGNVVDFSKYIDYNSHTVSTGTLYNEINYAFEDPQTILNTEFKKNNNDVGYGDLKLSIYDENGILIDGKKLELKLPFEQIVYERIVDLNGVDNPNIQYGLLLNESLDRVDLKPHIHYVENIECSIKVLNSTGQGTLINNANYPSHVLTNESKLFSSTFGSEFNEFDGVAIQNTIFKNYHEEFVVNVFNKEKRKHVYNAKNVPTDIIINLRLNDVISINKKLFRVESFKVNLNKNEVELNLFNVKLIDLSPIYPISVDSTLFTVDRTDITVDATKGERIQPIILV